MGRFQSERSSNTTKIETNVREMQQDQGQSQKEVLTQQRLKPPIIWYLSSSQESQKEVLTQQRLKPKAPTANKKNAIRSERSSNTTKIETCSEGQCLHRISWSERSSNTTKIETLYTIIFYVNKKSQKEVLTQQRLKLVEVCKRLMQRKVRKKF